jgi:hypothetical protein
MNKTIFLDTNIFLHYQPFTQINWLEIVNAESVTIVIPPITIRELNKHKDSHPRAQIKKRAGEIIKKLFGLLDSGQTSKIADGVFVFFEGRDSAIDFAAHQLNFNVQDDQLMASILLRKQEAPEQPLVLVTSDLGLALVAKAGRQGISTKMMPDNFRIADEPDPSESKVKRLEQQIREMNARVPVLSLAYENGDQYMPINLPSPVLLSESEIDTKVTEIKNKFPKRSIEGLSKKIDLPNNPIDKVSFLAGQSLIMNVINQEEIERYNKEVEQFISACESFIVKNNEFENLKRRTIRLDIALVNQGTTPAEDIDIYMHFPDGFRLLNEDELPDRPETPDLPEEPMTALQRIANHSLSPVLSSSMFNYRPDVLPMLPSNVSSPRIKRVNSYEVHVHVQKLKHNLQELLDPLFVVFESFENAKSFTIDYRILAANIPQEVTGNLHVVIQKESAN